MELHCFKCKNKLRILIYCGCELFSLKSIEGMSFRFNNIECGYDPIYSNLRINNISIQIEIKSYEDLIKIFENLEFA